MGGPGSDYLEGDLGNDASRCDRVSTGSAMRSGRTGRTTISGGGRRDRIVGDNYGTGDAAGGRDDELPEQAGPGRRRTEQRRRSSATSEVIGSGTARGAGDDDAAPRRGRTSWSATATRPAARLQWGNDALNGDYKAGTSSWATATRRPGPPQAAATTACAASGGTTASTATTSPPARTEKCGWWRQDSVDGTSGNDRLKGGPGRNVCGRKRPQTSPGAARRP